VTVIDLPRPAVDAPEAPAATPLSWDEPAHRPPSQFWCLRCARWHDRRDLGPEGTDGAA
jgi:hypothetical protein